jgi:hypothetical protein
MPLLVTRPVLAVASSQQHEKDDTEMSIFVTINGPHAVALGFQRGLIHLPRIGPERWGAN